MATKIKSKSETEETKKITPYFTKENYIIAIIGLICIAVGYILMIGGGSENPEVFNEAIFNTQRMVISPLLLVIGYVIEVFAIFYQKKQ